MPVDENRVYNITNRLAFPRLVGSMGEKKAREIIIDEIKKAGYTNIHNDTFKTSIYSWIFVRYIFVVMGLILVGLAFSFYVFPIITLFLVFGFFIGLFKFLGMATPKENKLMRNEDKNFLTENIFINLKSKNQKAKIVFMAHYDSKSQTFPTSIRMLIFLISIFGLIILLFIYVIFSILKILLNFNVPILNDILLYISIVIAGVGFLNFFNKTGNLSPGATDNATSVATVIELARFFKESPLDNIELTFLLTSSEELNLGGAVDFINKHQIEFEKDSTFFINFDTIGSLGDIRIVTSHGIPRKISSKKLRELFINSSKELEIAIKNIYVPVGAWSDEQIMVKFGYQACVLGSVGGIKYIHTKKDNMDLVSKQGLKNILLLSIDVAKKLNNEKA